MSDPQPRADMLSTRLHKHEAALSPELRRAARWAVAHPTELCFHSVRDAAREAGVSAPTMSRLAQALGFTSFAVMRQQLRNALTEATREGYVERLDQQLQSGRRTDVHDEQGVAMLLANARSAIARNTPQAYAQVATQLLRARSATFLGLRVSFGLAHHLHYRYALVAPNGRLVHDLGGDLNDCIAELDARDVLVALSLAPYTRQTVELVERAHRAGIPVIALTDSPVSPIGRLAVHTLLFDTASPSFFQSMVGAQAVVETLVAEVALRANARARKRLAMMQQHFTDIRAYWERPQRR